MVISFELSGKNSISLIVQLYDQSDSDSGNDTALSHALELTEKYKTDDCRQSDIHDVKDDLDILISPACDLTDRAVHCFTGEHGDAALKLEPDPECEHKTTDSKIEQLLRIIAHGDIVDQKAGKICQIAVNKRQYRLNDDLNGLAFSPKQGNLYRDLDYAEYIQPAAEGEQIADQRYRIRHRRNRRGSQPCLGREGNAHRGDEESDQEQ